MASHRDWKMNIVMLESKFFKLYTKYLSLYNISFKGEIALQVSIQNFWWCYLHHSYSAIYTDSDKIFHRTISYKNLAHIQTNMHRHTRPRQWLHNRTHPHSEKKTIKKCTQTSIRIYFAHKRGNDGVLFWSFEFFSKFRFADSLRIRIKYTRPNPKVSGVCSEDKISKHNSNDQGSNTSAALTLLQTSWTTVHLRMCACSATEQSWNG